MDCYLVLRNPIYIFEFGLDAIALLSLGFLTQFLLRYIVVFSD